MRTAFVLCVVLALCAMVLGASVKGYTQTPSGHVRSDCVHRVPSGASVTELEDGRTQVISPDGSVRIIPICDRRQGPVLLRDLPFDYDGWLAYTVYNDTQGFDSFLGDFSVPDTPKDDPDILYIFTGLQNIDWIPKVCLIESGFLLISSSSIRRIRSLRVRLTSSSPFCSIRVTAATTGL
jgi:hypothetical protein